VGIKIKIAILVVIWGILFISQFIVGMPFSAILNWQEIDIFLLKQFRLPAAIAASIGGGLLSLSGLQMQTYFRNPLAGPYVTGVSAGASLGIAFMVFIAGIFQLPFQQAWLTFLFSFGGSVVIFFFVVSIAKKLKSSAGLLLVGLMITSAVAAFVQLFQLLMSNTSLRDFFIWSQGSFYAITNIQIVILVLACIAVLFISYHLCKPYDLLLLGEDTAKLAGVNIPKTKQLSILSAALSASVVTAFCGPIGFVGLAAPHIARLFIKSNYHYPLSIACFLIGGIICLFCQGIVFSQLFGIAIPINILTAMFGAPFVIWLILKKETSL